MNEIVFHISERKALVFELDNCAVKALLPLMVRMAGEPTYVIKPPTDGEVGSPRREIVVEPVPISTPVPETVPVQPEPTPA